MLTLPKQIRVFAKKNGGVDHTVKAGFGSVFKKRQFIKDRTPLNCWDYENNAETGCALTSSRGWLRWFGAQFIAIAWFNEFEFRI